MNVAIYARVQQQQTVTYFLTVLRVFWGKISARLAKIVLSRLRLKLQEDIYTNVFDYAVCKEYCIATIGEFISEWEWNIRGLFKK